MTILLVTILGRVLAIYALDRNVTFHRGNNEYGHKIEKDSLALLKRSRRMFECVFIILISRR